LPRHPSLSPSAAGLSRPLRLPRVGLLGLEAPATGSITPHPHRLIAGGFGLGCPPFGRPYSGDLILISLPPPTKMFPFGGFPPEVWVNPRPRAPRVYPVVGVPIRGSRVRRLPAPPPGISPLAAPFFGARAEPSTVRLNAVSLLGEAGLVYAWACGAHGSMYNLELLTPFDLGAYAPRSHVDRHPRQIIHICPAQQLE